MEFRELQRQPFYDWAADDDRYKAKLADLYKFISVFASLPIAYTTYHRIPFELPQLFLSANIGTLAVMTPFVARLRIGYGYVSQRLREKTFYYEAQQRGLFAKKDEESALRDRLTERSEVSPALQRIDASIAALVAAMIISIGSGEACKDVSLNQGGWMGGGWVLGWLLEIEKVRSRRSKSRCCN